MSFLFRTSQHKIIEVKSYPEGNIHTLLLLAAYYVANISREKKIRLREIAIEINLEVCTVIYCEHFKK
jgi:hypothetical protein